MNIETERLVLRPPRAEDAEEMHKLWHSGFVTKYNCMTPMSLDKMREKLAREACEGENVHLVLKSTGQVIGMVGVGEDSLRWQAGSVMLDYFLGQDHARRGYMTEALRGVISHLFAEKPVEIITVRVFADNAASVALVEKLGFVHEGTLRRAVRSPDGVLHDDRLYSLMRAEWLA